MSAEPERPSRPRPADGPERGATRTREQVVPDICAWYAAHARDLPWRERGVSAWGVMVSEFMLQQTPVSRVLPRWREWMERWPTPADLSVEPVGEAVRAWGHLGYPRRAQRLWQAAAEIAGRFGNVVPDDLEDLRSLPGVGEYTAAAIASFAYGRRHVVLDTNVRRVLARLDGGVAQPPATVTRAERDRARSWLPDDDADAALWAVAAMELGAQVCVATTPDCGRCPVRSDCAWARAGYPAWTGPARRGQAYAGTDRQCRGALLAVLRESDAPRHEADLLAAWPVDAAQADRALASLLADGLVRREDAGLLSL
ncbi:HhH-GPD family protein [Nigerium massiliense]|uniref:A/G-specific adenine glycosylase n=1 Tax=Nigerium massiliense TaxID=1522317 RepID=UPI0005912C21|nr:A/G-specific adenine glycosylase [Nigerium massiliense]